MTRFICNYNAYLFPLKRVDTLYTCAKSKRHSHKKYLPCLYLNIYFLLFRTLKYPQNLEILIAFHYVILLDSGGVSK